MTNLVFRKYPPPAVLGRFGRFYKVAYLGGLFVFMVVLAYGWTHATASLAAVEAGPQISQVQASAATVGRYEKFEITFRISGTTASTLDLPYDPAPPPGVTPGTGITVDALLSNDNWETTFVQPAFIYQPFTRSRQDDLEHLYPAGDPLWKVRFAPRKMGNWRYRLRAIDAAGTTYFPANGDLSVTVIESESPGFLRVSATDPRYFEFDNGHPFIGLGHNESFETFDAGTALSTYDADEKLSRFQETGINFIRAWLSTSGIAGSAWAPWTSHIRPYYGNVPYVILSAEETYTADGLSMKLTPYDACVFQGFQGGPAPVLPNKTYQVLARVKTVDVTDPATAGYPYGFTVKTGGWLGGTNDPNNALLCDDPDQGTALTPHVSGATDWQVVTGTFSTAPDQYFLDNFYLVLDNALVTNDPQTEGKVYIDEVRVQEVLPGGQLGPNVIKKPNMSMHTYFDQAPAWQWDYILDRAAAAGVYLKLVVLEKDDLLYSRINSDGVFVDLEYADDDNSYAQPNTRVRWLHQAWWRYLIARWGYSTATHSWELYNEGDPFSDQHYEQTQALAQYIDQNDPSRHMVTTSFWAGYPVPEFWANPAYRAVDYADVHAYISTGEGLYPFWGDGFEAPLEIEGNPAHTVEGAGWSIRIPGNQPFDFINRMSLNIRGQGVWTISYQMKAENYSGLCDEGYPDSLAGPRLFWDLGQNDEAVNSNQVPPSPDSEPWVCAAPAGTYDWTEFSSERTAVGDPAPASARLILDNTDWYELILYFRNDASSGGSAWIDNIQITNPQGERVPINGEFDLTPMDQDAALYTASRSMRDGAASPIGAGKPLVRGEAGLDYTDRQEEQEDLALDTGGVWFHNFIWGQINPGGMYDLYWWTANIWSNDLHRHARPYQDFMDGIPLNNGDFVDAEAISSEPGLRTWGQKDLSHQQAHLWIQNRQHTWRNVVNGVAISPLNGTITIPDMTSGPYMVEWWDTYSGQIVHTEFIAAGSGLTLTLPQPISDDIAVKVHRPWVLSPSTKTVDRALAAPGDLLHYTITLVNAGSQPVPAGKVEDPAPSYTTYVIGSDQASTGAITLTTDLLEWAGTVPANSPVTITFQAQVASGLEDPLPIITNRATISDGETIFERQALTTLSLDLTPTSTPTPTETPSPTQTTTPTNTPTATQTPLSAPPLTYNKSAFPTLAGMGETITYVLSIVPQDMPPTTTTWVTDTLPSQFSFVRDSLSASVKPALYQDGQVLWSGIISTTSQMTITYRMTVATSLPLAVTNLATFYNAALDTSPLTKSALVIVNPRRLYLPLILKQD